MQDDSKRSEQGKIPDADRMREQMVSRTDISPVIEQILEGSFQPEISNEELNINFETLTPEKTFIPEHILEAKIIWDKTKLERNSCIAIFTGEVWNAFATERAQFEPTLPDPNGPEASKVYSRLANQTLDVWRNVLNEWKKYRDAELKKPAEEWTQLDMSYARYKKILNFGRVNEIIRDDEASFIERGGETAAAAMWGLVRMIATLSKEQNIALTEDELTEIYNKAFGPIVGAFSAMNQEVGIDLIDRVGLTIDTSVQGVNTKFFRLVEDKKKDAPYDPTASKKYKLSMNHELLYTITDDEGKPLITKQPSTETTWCPARYSIGKQKDVIREYSEWVLELAKKYCFPQIEAKGKAQDEHDRQVWEKIQKLFKGK